MFFYELPFLHWHIFFSQITSNPLQKKQIYHPNFARIAPVADNSASWECVFLRNIFGTLIDTYYDILNKVDFFLEKE